MLLKLFADRFWRKAVNKDGAQSSVGNVYVNLTGGLGNQLFQYAFAHYLIKNGIGVAGLATNSYDNDAYQRSLLIGDVSRLPLERIGEERRRTMQMALSEDGEAVRQFLSDGNPSAQWLCRGYWQNPLYVEASRQELTGDLLAHFAKHFNSRPAPVNECAIHIRRSNYGQNGLLPVSYYLSALEESHWPKFSVITDEPNFCTSMFRGTKGFCGVVSNSQANPWQDFFFLQRSRIQIIANSSFSWWSAWLGDSAGVTEKIFAPSEWSVIVDNQPCPAAWTMLQTRLLRP